MKALTDADFTIRGLPEEIAVVPHWPADLSENGWRAEWRRWADLLSVYRSLQLEEALANPHVAAEERRLCALYPEYFLAMYGWIYEPRDDQIVDDDGDEWSEWLPFPHQVLMVHWIERMMAQRRPMGDGAILKSRDMGATWTVCLFCAHQWLFARKFSASLISYKEDMVDAAMDPDSMFWKIEAILGIVDGSPGLPWYLFDPVALGWDPRKHDRQLGLAFPGTNKFIKGSATTVKSGSGTRARFSVVDEAAKVPKFKQLLASKRAAGSHDLILSSAYTDEGPDFEEIVRLAREDEEDGRPGKSFLWLDPRYHPNNTPDRLADILEGYKKDGNEHAYYREMMGDFQAGATGWIYWELVERAKDLDKGYDPEQTLYVGIDPGFRDDTAIAWANAVPVPNQPPTFHWLGVYERNLVTARWYAHLLTGIPPRPGDEYFDPSGKLWTNAEHEVCLFFRRAWASGTVVVAGDPAGNQKIAATPESFYDVLLGFSNELQEWQIKEDPSSATWCEPGSLWVFYSELHQANDHFTRRGALRGVFNRGATYSTDYRAQRLKDKHRRARFQERTREATTDPKPVHDDDSHAVAASEYMSVWLDFVGIKARKEAARRAPDRERFRPGEKDKETRRKAA